MRIVTMLSVFIFTAVLIHASGPATAQTIDCSYVCNPTEGTVPFNVTMTVTLTNYVVSTHRRVAGRIDVYLDIYQDCDGNSHSITNWRSGYTTIAPGDSFVTSWSQNIPAVRRVIGTDQFVLTAVDITPAPYNQPPYPSSGDVCTAVCEIVANGDCS